MRRTTRNLKNFMEDHTMRFNYKDNDYELTELKEPKKNEIFDIIAIFKIKYCVWNDGDLVEVSKEVYEESDEQFKKLEFIDYFYGANEEDEVLISISKEIIDRRNA